MLLTTSVLSLLLIGPTGQEPAQGSEQGKVTAKASVEQAPSPWWKPIGEHLAFRGYSCDVADNAGFKYLQCRHDLWLDVAISKGTIGFTVDAFLLGEVKEPPTAELALLANRLNQESDLVRFFWDNEGDLTLEGTFMGEYEKARFSHFMDMWDSDQQLVQTKYLAELQRVMAEGASNP